MAKLDTLKVDVDELNEGRWFEDILPGSGFDVKLRGRESRAYRQAIAKYLQPFYRRLNRRQVDAEKQDELMRLVEADGLVADWRSTDGSPVSFDGRDFPYTIGNARRLMADPAFVRLRDAINEAVGTWFDEKDTDLQELLGNSLTTPPGGPSGENTTIT